MAELKRGIISPVLEHGQGFVFNAAGQNFKITGSHIQPFNEANADLSNLVKANSIFNINENGVEFFYDFNNKVMVSELSESAIENFNKTLDLTEKINFVNENKKALKRKRASVEALTEVEKELAVLESERNAMGSVQRGIKFTYVAETNAFYTNGTEMLLGSEETLTEKAFSFGYIKYADKELLNLFEFAAKNYNAYKILDFIAESIDGDVKVLTMKTGPSTFVYRMNEATKLSKFSKMLPDAAVEYVAEQTGTDVTYLVEDILESFAQRREAKRNKVRLMHEMIAFLKDQKGRLAEADRNLPDIKAADHLINTEIERLSEELDAAQNEDLLTVSDGYLNATLKGEVDGLAKGTELKVDAVEYSGAGRDDVLTVFVQEEPLRIEKFRIELEAGAII